MSISKKVFIDSINTVSSTTGRKVLVHDTATGKVERVDPSVLGGGTLVVGAIDAAGASTDGAIIRNDTLFMQLFGAEVPGLTPAGGDPAKADTSDMLTIDTTGVQDGDVATWDAANEKVIFEAPTGGSTDSTWHISFKTGVTTYAPSAGDSTFKHSYLVDKVMDVYREGVHQVYDDSVGYTYVVADTTIKFYPVLDTNERIDIVLRDSTRQRWLALEAPPSPAPLLLDTYTNSLGAYSLRRLKTSYSGNAIKVRRSSDNTTQDIAFLSSGYLDTASLKTFVSTGTGYIDTWYDQSGNSYNLTQSTLSNQPIIIESGGTVYRVESNVSIKFTSASSHYLTNSSITASSAADAYIAQVFMSNSSSSNYIPFGMSGQNFAYQHGAGANRIYAYAGNVFGEFANATTVMGLSETIYDGGGSTNADKLKYYLDGTGLTAVSYSGTVPATVSFTGLAIGKLYAVGVYFDGACNEFIAWMADKSADRTGIESNINTFYSLW